MQGGSETCGVTWQRDVYLRKWRMEAAGGGSREDGDGQGLPGQSLRPRSETGETPPSQRRLYTHRAACASLRTWLVRDCQFTLMGSNQCSEMK